MSKKRNRSFVVMALMVVTPFFTLAFLMLLVKAGEVWIGEPASVSSKLDRGRPRRHPRHLRFARVADARHRKRGPVLSAARQESLFDGVTIVPEKDETRLAGQLKRVAELMADHEWRTLGEIQAKVGGSEAGVSARLRDLRKRKFGGHFLERRRRKTGDAGPETKSALWEYRLVL